MFGLRILCNVQQDLSRERSPRWSRKADPAIVCCVSAWHLAKALKVIVTCKYVQYGRNFAFCVLFSAQFSTTKFPSESPVFLRTCLYSIIRTQAHTPERWIFKLLILCFSLELFWLPLAPASQHKVLQASFTLPRETILRILLVPEEKWRGWADGQKDWKL